MISFKKRSGFQVPPVPKKALNRVLPCLLLLFVCGCAGGRYLQVRRPDESKGVDRVHAARTSPLTIRVAVERNVRSLVIAGHGVRAVSIDRAAALSSGGGIAIEASSARVGGTVLTLPITISSTDGVSPLQMNGRRFEGELIVFRDLVVNVLPLETYLKGVLSSEIPGGWPAESLKAQAVVSRTFALRKIIDRKGESFDVDDSEMDQKYSFPERNSSIENAIAETEGTILSYGGAPIEAFFHASSGGVTESCRNVFQKDLPYLRSARDPYTERAGEPGWTCAVNAMTIANRVSTLLTKKGDPAAGLAGIPPVFGALTDVRVRSRTESGRVREFALFFAKGGEYVVKGNDFRLALDPKTLKSLLLERVDRKTVNGETVFNFAGKGYGHGVGMSQLGAKAMAEMGFGYRSILGFYYRGARVERWNGR